MHHTPLSQFLRLNHKGAPWQTPERQTPEIQTPLIQTSERQTPEIHSPLIQTSERQTPERLTPDKTNSCRDKLLKIKTSEIQIPWYQILKKCFTIYI